jgi:hypothetical protein
MGFLRVAASVTVTLPTRGVSWYVIAATPPDSP